MKFTLVLPAVLLSLGLHAAAGNCKPGLWYCGKYLQKLELPKYEFLTTQAAFNGQLHPGGIPDTLMLCNTEPQGPYVGYITRVGKDCGPNKCVSGGLDQHDYCA
ncbi:hypothetical protein C8J57DRAFT_1471550 [Mycena rebaudengoi]|nr:hypothetical protein C8J57DRAFT_1471550 [Mycena rebaudengoi]